MKENQIIRKAGSNDLTTIAEINGEVHGIHVNARPSLFKPLTLEERIEWLKGLINDPQYRLFVAEQEKLIVGYLLLKIERRPENPFQKAWSFLYLDHISVVKDLRGSGVGKALINFAKDYAKQSGFSELVLDVWGFNEEAKAFFESQGFSALINRLGVTL